MKKKLAPSREDLYELYIIQNLSQEAVGQHYGTHKKVAARWLKELDITKPVELQCACKDKTCIEKYGTSVISHVDSINEKRRQTCLKQYGGNSSMSDPAVRKKIFDQITAPLIPYDELYQYYVVERHSIQDCAKRFELSTTTIDKQIKQYNMSKSKEQVCQDRAHTNMMKYGVNFTTQVHHNDNLRHILFNKEAFIQYITSSFNYKPSFTEVSIKLKVSPPVLSNIVKEFDVDDLFDHSSSKAEVEILNLLQDWGVNCILRERHQLNGYEIDIYCPELKLGIEYNGDFWHSNHKKDKNYHLDKSLLAESKGIRIIHIYEYEWNDPIKKEKIIALLRIATGNVERKIYARQCTIKQITNKEAKVLNDKIHLQGHRNAQVTYGLYYKDELVQLMSFSKTKYNRNLKSDDEWEIIRGCPGSNNIVVGGVSKLFKHFVNDYHPKKVFSYCDFNKFNGASYEALGMTCIGMTGPDKTWIIEGKGVPRNPSKYKELKELASGVVWGAGSKKYEITFNHSN